MWTAWDLGTIEALLGAALLALALAALLAKAAYLLPRALDSSIPAGPSLAHKRFRNGFWALGLRLAGRLQAGQPLRFGPYLAAAGMLALTLPRFHVH